MTEFQDDDSIPDDAVLWRRIPPSPGWVTYDDNLGYKRPSSGAFDDHPNGSPMSVLIADECEGPEEALEGNEGFYLVEFTAGDVRALEPPQGVVPAPRPDQPAHAHVCGRKTYSVRSTLAKELADWVVGPEEK